jgi:hypothetical protein
MPMWSNLEVVYICIPMWDNLEVAYICMPMWGDLEVAYICTPMLGNLVPKATRVAKRGPYGVVVYICIPILRNLVVIPQRPQGTLRASKSGIALFKKQSSDIMM